MSADECPFCGAGLGRKAADPSTVAVDRRGNTLSTHDSRFFPLDDLPGKRRVDVIRDDRQTAILKITGGGRRSTSLLIFAAVWNAIAWPVFIIFAVTADDVPRIATLIPGLLVIVGLGMTYVGLRMKFGQTLVLLESERIALQHILFGWKTTKQFSLDEDSRASLEMAYQQNNEPVYRVEVHGSNGTAKLATSLSYQEKQWLVNGINNFLQGEIAPDLAAAADRRGLPGRVVGEIARPLDPSTYVDNGTVRVDSYSDQLLYLSWKPLPSGKLTLFATAMASGSLIFSAIMIGFFIGPQFVKSVTAQDWFSVAFNLPSLLACLVPSLLGLFVMCARVHVNLNESQIGMGLGVLFLRYQYLRQLTDVTSVVIAEPERSTMLKVTSRSGTSRTVKYIPPGCVVKLEGIKYPIPLTVGHSQQVSADVGGMIRYHLDRFGIVLSDQTVFDTSGG